LANEYCRNVLVVASLQYICAILWRHSISVIQTFRPCSMYPRARIIHFRSTIGSILTRQLLCNFDTVFFSKLCPVCDNSIDSLRHFFVGCAPNGNPSPKLWFITFPCSPFSRKCYIACYFSFIYLMTSVRYHCILQSPPPPYRNFGVFIGK
jgi:hypothetical protein